MLYVWLTLLITLLSSDEVSYYTPHKLLAQTRSHPFIHKWLVKKVLPADYFAGGTNNNVNVAGHNTISINL